MKIENYLKELKLHLVSISDDRKRIILEDMENYINDSRITYDVLVKQFGTPKHLARQHIEATLKEEKNDKKLGIRVKKILLIVVNFIAVISVCVAYYIYDATKDSFDYSLYDESSIDKKIKYPWQTVHSIQKIDISQSKVIMYWSNSKNVQISCNDNTIKQANSTLYISRASCILKLPKQKFDINTYQTKLVLIEPNEEINLYSVQSMLSLSSKDTKYKFSLNGEKSELENFQSDNNGIGFNASLFKSRMSVYEY